MTREGGGRCDLELHDVVFHLVGTGVGETGPSGSQDFALPRLLSILFDDDGVCSNGRAHETQQWERTAIWNGKGERQCNIEGQSGKQGGRRREERVEGMRREESDEGKGAELRREDGEQGRQRKGGESGRKANLCIWEGIPTRVPGDNCRRISSFNFVPGPVVLAVLFAVVVLEILLGGILFLNKKANLHFR